MAARKPKLAETEHSLIKSYESSSRVARKILQENGWARVHVVAVNRIVVPGTARLDLRQSLSCKKRKTPATSKVAGVGKTFGIESIATALRH
jgi:hypothetical protein